VPTRCIWFPSVRRAVAAAACVPSSCCKTRAAAEQRCGIAVVLACEPAAYRVGCRAVMQTILHGSSTTWTKSMRTPKSKPSIWRWKTCAPMKQPRGSTSTHSSPRALHCIRSIIACWLTLCVGACPRSTAGKAAIETYEGWLAELVAEKVRRTKPGKQRHG
jgi:hypothetical protein